MKERGKKPNPQPILEYMKKFLSSNSSELMEYCYAAIRDPEQSRFHRNQIEKLEDNQFDVMFALVSCVILTANKIECDALNYMLSQQDNKAIIRRENPLPIFVDSNFGAPEAYIIKHGSSYILHMRAYETGSNTPGGSTDLVRYITNNKLLRPNIIISFGICYGRDSNTQEIGDVIIPKKLYPWSVGQKITEDYEGKGERFSIKHDNFNLNLEEMFSSNKIYSLVRELCDNDDNQCHISFPVAFASKGQRECTRDFSVKISWGDMSTGEAVISSARVKEVIKEAAKNDRELGGEMEGYGLAKECIYYAHIPCLIIKAICDWGENKNIDHLLEKESIIAPSHLKDKLQAYAAFCAGIALTYLLKCEKNAFLSLKFLQWLGIKKYLNSHIYSDKEKAIKYIKYFYHVSNEMAQDVFNMLEYNDIIIRVKNRSCYHLNPKFES